MSKEKIVMPRRLRQKWLDALRSGKYSQAQNTLYSEGEGYCCLGVLEHIAMKGNVECRPDPHSSDPEAVYPLDSPSKGFYAQFRIEMPKRIEDRLIDANDSGSYADPDTGEYVVVKGFRDIADLIEANSRGR